MRHSASNKQNRQGDAMNKRTVIKNSQNQNKPKSISKTIGSLALVTGLFLLTSVAVASEKAQYDDVFFNDYKLGFFEQMALEGHIDRDIPDGKYWFELETGMWGPIGGTAYGRIVIPEDYQEYVATRLFKQSKAIKVELAASVELSSAKDNPVYVKTRQFKPRKAIKVELAASVELSYEKDNRVYVKTRQFEPRNAIKVKLASARDPIKPRLLKTSQTAHVERSTATEECDQRCWEDFIYKLVDAFSPRL
jgi:hypothetical protein